jgi:hypothetical protein
MKMNELKTELEKLSEQLKELDRKIDAALKGGNADEQ